MALILNKDFTFSGKSLNITKEKNKLLEPYNKQIWNYGIVLALKPNDKQKEQLNQLPHSKLWGLNEVFDLVLFWCCF